MELRDLIQRSKPRPDVYAPVLAVTALQLAAENETLKATISRLERMNAELMKANTEVNGACMKEAVLADQRNETISRLREYARHKPSCCWWRGPSCDCGYNALMAEVGETK